VETQGTGFSDFIGFDPQPTNHGGKEDQAGCDTSNNKHCFHFLPLFFALIDDLSGCPMFKHICTCFEHVQYT
jgi:hypothetical protein